MAAPHLVGLRDFSSAEHATWKLLFERQAAKRAEQVVDLFSRGVRVLGLSADRIPDLDKVNLKLSALTGFRGVAVEGFEEPESFYEMLARREFPIGYFIRDPQDLGYTPAPDVFHDLYGHLPFLVDTAYADFCQSLGERTMRFAHQPELLRQWERLFWYGAEFPLVRTPEGNRIFGAGIASSYDECAYALGPKPKVLPFDPETIRHLDFDISRIQETIFLLESPEQLYGCLDEFEKGCLPKST